MRLDELHLEFFGHFSGKRFEFGSVTTGTEPDFHVIYGPNEAGKTTFMEAYLRLLYGFLPREPYDFIHQRKNLRVSGVLRIDGASKTFVRLSNKKGSLLDQNGVPLLETALQASLGGLSMQDYRNLLCIDDETIEKGGEEIVNSQGDVGTLLFSAAAGISDLSTVLSAVREEADLLYKKNSSRTQLAVLKSQLKELDAQIAEQDVSAAQFKKLKVQLKAAEIALEEIKAQSATLTDEQQLLQKQLDALPLLQEIDELDEILTPLAHYPKHIEIDSQQLLDMLPLEAEAKSEIERRSKELQSYKDELAQIHLDEKQLSIAESLEQLQPLFAGAYTTARLGLDAERKKLADVQQNMVLVVRDFADEHIDPVQLLVSASLINELDQCAKEKSAAANELQSAKSELRKAEDSIAEKRASAVALSTAEDVDQSVSKILEEFNGQVFLTEVMASQKRVDEADAEFRKALDGLALKGQKFNHAPNCSLHPTEAEDLFKELEVLNRDTEKAARDASGLAELIQFLQSEIAQIEDIEGFADDEKLATLKHERDTAWQTHRKQYRAESADIFEATMLQCDKGMESRVANASQLGELRKSRQRIDSELEKAARLRDQLEQWMQRIEAIDVIFADCVRDAGLNVAVSTNVAKNWILQCEDAAAKERAVERVRAEESQVLQKAKRLHSALSQYIVRDSATLQELMVAAQDIDSVYRTRQKQLAEDQATLSTLEVGLKRQLERVEELTLLRDEKNNAWRELVNKSFSVVIDPDKLEPELSTLHTLRELDRDRVATLQQVQSMEGAIERFSTEIESLSARMGVSFDEGITQTYDALKSLAAATLDAHRRKTQLLELINVAEDFLAQAAARLETNRVLREQLAENFDSTIPTSSIKELIDAERIARETIQARKSRSDTEKKLLQALALSSLDEARSQLLELDATALQGRLRELATDFKVVDDRLHKAIEQRTLCKSALDAVIGDATVAELEQQRTTVELEMTDVALEHLKLSLGHKLAQNAIMQYREKHRSSMMKAAESVFTELTNGAYSRLQSNTNGSVETLQVVQANGTAKSVHEPGKGGKRADASKGPQSDLSKGTRFQLYLALRAAAYEQLAAQGTCLPFICDDIFETFDEGRTRAACRVLQRIGTTGQAIYLTHHQHVVDIATEVCGENVTIHQL